MMRTYQYYSAKLAATIRVSYMDGILKGFECENIQVSERDTMSVIISEELFLKECKERKVNLTVLDRVITFEIFWEAYKQKDCGRKKGEEAWNKLTKEEQLGAYDYIPAINATLKLNGTAKPYATTYLNQKRWIK